MGAKWHFTVPSQGFPQPTTYTLLESVGDTTIQGQQCSKLQFTYNNKGSYYGFSSVTYVYSSNNKVFWYNPQRQNFSLLYDFAALPGSSWYIVLPCTSPRAPGWLTDSIQVTVSSVSTVTAGSRTLRVLHTNTLGTVVEQVGSLDSPFPEIVTSCTGIVAEGNPWKLRCYEDGIIGKFRGPDTVACDSILATTVGLPETHQAPQVLVYPTVAQQIITVETAQATAPAQVRICNMLGQEVWSGNTGSGKTQIDVSQLKPGWYSIRVYTGSRYSAGRFFMKQ